MAQIEAASLQLALESLAVGGRIPGGQAGRPDRSELDAGPGLDQPFARRHRRHGLLGVDQPVLRHPQDNVVAAFLRETEGDAARVRRRRRRHTEGMADDDVHVCPSREIHRDVDGATIGPDEAICAVLVAAAALHVLGATIRLTLEPKLFLEGLPPYREDLLAVWRIDRRISVDMIDGLASAAMTRAGDDLSQLGM